MSQQTYLTSIDDYKMSPQGSNFIRISFDLPIVDAAALLERGRIKVILAETPE